MKRFLPIVSSFIFFVTAVMSVPAWADDIEIFRASATQQSSVPNLLMVVDTSGSMGTKDVTVPAEAYDATKTYSGRFDTGDWYALVNCGRYGCDAHRMDKSLNQCDAAAAELASNGVFDGNMARLVEGENRTVTERVCENVCTRWFWGFCIRSERRCEDQTTTYSEPSRWETIEENHSNDEVAYDCERDEVGNSVTEYAAINGSFDNSTGGDLPSAAYTSSEDFEDRLNWSSEDYSARVVTGNYLNWQENHNDEKTVTRLKAVQNVLHDVIGGMDNVNFGLMDFYGKGRVIYPVSLVNDDRVQLLKTVDDLEANGGTPLQEALHESGRYLMGDTYYYGERGVSSAFESDGKTYDSPILNECQANAVVLLTDGEPTDYGTDNVIHDMIKPVHEKNGTRRCTSYRDNGNDYTRYCLPEIAQFMRDFDLSSGLDGDQTAQTFTVGFKSDQELLQDTASKGQGNYFQANDSVELTQALKDIVRKIKSESSTFTTPGVAVNNYGRLTNREEIYYALFLPRESDRWGGNLKRYKITNDGTIVDQDGQPAVDEATGFFKASARSYWSLRNDGNEVESGGAASRQSVPRKVYTYTDGSAPKDASLAMMPSAQLEPGNSDIEAEDLGLGPSQTALRTRVLRWAQGYDTEDDDGDGSTSDVYGYIGDPLHSSPTLVTYSQTATGSNSTIFFGSNEGFVHGIDAETGAEQFAFMPKELLGNLNAYRADKDAVVVDTKPYGMDAEIGVWVNDLNQDGSLHTSGGSIQGAGTSEQESAYIYAGMRRGGRSYYALDVTMPDAPVLKWHISGDDSHYLSWSQPAAFKELGQTWSKPLVSLVKWGGDDGDPRVVLFFTGGYDEDQDDATDVVADDVGRALYMVDAETGELLWSAGPTAAHDLQLSGMQYSFPATPAVVDTTGDGYVNMVVAPDVGGNVWRFDIDNENEGSEDVKVTGGKIAELSQSGEPVKFFASPDVSIIQKEGVTPFLSIALGSGARPSPLSKKVQDAFFMIKQKDFTSAPKDSSGKVAYDTIRKSDLYNSSSLNMDALSTTEQAKVLSDISKANGWYMDYDVDGEKSLGASLTFNGQIIFTSFSPGGSGTGCGPDTGTNRLYIRDVLTGTTTIQTNNGTLDNQELQQPGIAPEPTVLFLRKEEDGKVTQVPQIIVGTEVIKDQDGCGIADASCGNGSNNGNTKDRDSSNTSSKVQFWFEER
ncbi:conserved hypothetical protein [gamma proteobacterium HTCC5015]|nr:conserved hypothetical protein [gamma proteobacterium HTCC5015]